MIAAKRLLKEWKATPNKQRSTVRTDDETVPGATFVQPGVPKVNDTKVCFGYKKPGHLIWDCRNTSEPKRKLIMAAKAALWKAENGKDSIVAAETEPKLPKKDKDERPTRKEMMEMCGYNGVAVQSEDDESEKSIAEYGFCDVGTVWRSQKSPNRYQKRLNLPAHGSA